MFIAVAALLAGLLAPPQANAGVGAESGIAIDSEINCFAPTIYFEAPGESDRGKLAVGHVVHTPRPGRRPNFTTSNFTISNFTGGRLRVREPPALEA